MEGVIQLTSDNRIVVLSGFVPAWEDSFDAAYEGAYDPETGAVSWGIDYAGLYHFDIIITPQPEDSNATFEIEGNSKLKNNSKIVIQVVSPDGTKCDYTIQVTKSSNGWKIILILVVMVALVAFAGYSAY